MSKPRNAAAWMNVSRRNALATGLCLAMMSRRAAAAPLARAGFAKDVEREGMVEVKGIHQGAGKGRIKLFRFDGASAPAHFLVYELEPGASEGTHVHFLDNRNEEGSFDEYYYIVSGRGRMEIDGQTVPVAAGDHVHTPLEVSHGIENTHPTENLRVFLTFIQRGSEPYPPRPRARAAS